MSDILFIVQWWSLLLIIGIIFLPTTSIIFKPFFDKGYIFAKIFGMVFVSYAIFLFGILKILPFTTTAIFLILLGFLILNLFILVKVTPWLRWNLVKSWKIFLFEEILFLSTLIFWSYIRAHQPDIHGLEKFMDFGFVNSILRSDSLPPKDMWFTPLPINYYYFGHLITAVLTKLSGIPSFITYNLMLATVFALTFTETFSIGANLINSLKKSVRGANKIFSGRTMDKEIMEKKNAIHLRTKKIFVGDLSTIKIILAGLLTAFLATLAGNLHTIYTFFKPYINDNPVPFWQLAFSPGTFPNSYWYPNATRFIYNTIHEFPSYSWVVADLHGHVLDIPFVLLTIAILLSLIQNAKFKMQNHSLKFKIFNFELQFYALRFTLYALLLAFLLAVMYMTNVWDGLIYALLTLTVFVYLAYRSKNYTLYAIRYTLIIIGFFLFSLPFNLNFKPFASGIGVLCSPAFLTNIGKIGPFLFEADHCQRSPLWQLSILYGFFYFWVFSFFVLLNKNCLRIQNAKFKVQNYNSKFKIIETFNSKLQLSTFNFKLLTISDIFVLLLIFLSTILIIIPEFIYIKDIYPAHYRANTMFKLVYQAFIMLSIASGYIIIRIISKIKNQKSKISNYSFVFFIFAILFFILVSIYPYFAINSYYGNLNTYYGLDGLSYLKKLYPTDYQAVLWINKNIKGQPVILEAQGDSYTDYARISANTGLPTVLGWTVHEWLWRGSYDIPAPRITDVQKLYEMDIYDQKEEIYKVQPEDYLIKIAEKIKFGDWKNLYYLNRNIIDNPNLIFPNQELKLGTFKKGLLNKEKITELKELIKKYHLSLVFIGDLERQKYPGIDEKKFETLGEVIYRNGQTRIYRINPAVF